MKEGKWELSLVWCDGNWGGWSFQKETLFFFFFDGKETLLKCSIDWD